MKTYFGIVTFFKEQNVKIRSFLKSSHEELFHHLYGAFSEWFSHRIPLLAFLFLSLFPCFLFTLPYTHFFLPAFSVVHSLFLPRSTLALLVSFVFSGAISFSFSAYSVATVSSLAFLFVFCLLLCFPILLFLWNSLSHHVLEICSYTITILGVAM